MICQNALKDSNKSDNKLKKFLSLNSASIKSTKARKLMIIKSVFFSKKRVAEINRIGNTEPTDKNWKSCGKIAADIGDLTSKLKNNWQLVN